MSRTYTIATNYSGMLAACVIDGADIGAAIKSIDIDPSECAIVEGLLLVDSPEDGDDVVYSGFQMGRLTDEAGVEFEYAVRRAQTAIEKTERCPQCGIKLQEVGAYSTEHAAGCSVCWAREQAAFKARRAAKGQPEPEDRDLGLSGISGFDLLGGDDEAVRRA